MRGRTVKRPIRTVKLTVTDVAPSSHPSAQTNTQFARKDLLRQHCVQHGEPSIDGLSRGLHRHAALGQASEFVE